MISLENILNIICTEAFEYGGIPEVPDHKHGEPQNYSALKRDARGLVENDARSQSSHLPVLRYTLELVRDSDGKVRWHE
jgi:hypothetical protein